MSDTRPPVPPPGPFATAAAVRTLAALVVLALLATAWVGLGRRRTGEPAPRPDDEPSGSTVPGELEVADDAQAVADDPPTAPAPDRGTVLPLGGDDGLPDGWRAETGTWSRDEAGIRLEEAPPTGAALAVTAVDALPWATVSLSGPPAGSGWGVVFGYAGPDDHFVVTVEGSTARVLRVEGGVEDELSTQEVPATDEVVVALDVTGRNVAVHVGTSVLPPVQVTSDEAARRIGTRAAAGADPGPLRWARIGVRARVRLDEPLVAAGEDVTEMTPGEARTHLGP